jgi:DNA-directed RNA polymerase subunit RPC12/RpoP
MALPHPTLTNWQIPGGFRQVPSAVEGITVYAPFSQEESAAPATPNTFKCPNCGANTEYNVAAGGVACEHCGYSVAVKAERVGLNASVFEFTLDALDQSERGWGVERQELLCQSCGAALSTEARAITNTCPFCGSHEVNLHAVSSDHLRPRFIIPFKVEKTELAQRTHEWLGKGWFHPDELAKQVGLDQFNGIYLPFWTFNAAIHTDWKAEVGYEREETYYNPSTKTTETRTVIDWVWRDGNTDVDIKDLFIPGTGRISHIILDKITPFDLSGLMSYAPDFLAGWKALAYDVPLRDAWEEGKKAMREEAKTSCYNDIDSSNVRNFNMSADFGDESWRYMLLPVYLASYRYEQKTYQVMVNGQNGTVAGQKPVAWWKIWLAVAALLAPGALLMLVGLPLMLAGGIGIVPLGLGALLFIIGLVISGFIYKSAIDSEAS